MLPFILRAQHVFDAPDEIPIAERALSLHRPLFLHLITPHLTRRGELAEGQQTVARIEWGRWIADCPFCPSAQEVSPDDPRFLCAGAGGCVNSPVEGAFVPVVFPESGALAEIESLLVQRPLMMNRNWLPGETTRDLLAENAAHLGGDQ